MKKQTFSSRWLRSLVELLAFVAVVLVSVPVAAQVACTSPEGTTCRGRITLDNGARMPYWRNFPISTPNSNIVRAVIVVHGVNRNANDYFGFMVDAARIENKIDSTIIISPHHQSSSTSTTDLRWSSGNWKEGGPSSNLGNLSSFTVMDQIVRRLANRAVFPNLNRIVVSGHSAGGQFMNRYAGGSRAQNSLTSHRFHYVVANPSSYMYLNTQRPVLTDLTRRTFRVPTTSCAFNDYLYGLADRNAYMSAVSSTTIRDQYRSRRVTYLLGSADTEQGGNLDESCAADFQGLNRFERGSWFFNYMQTFFPTTTHDRVVVPNVAHDGRGMFISPEGRVVLFTD